MDEFCTLFQAGFEAAVNEQLGEFGVSVEPASESSMPWNSYGLHFWIDDPALRATQPLIVRAAAREAAYALAHKVRRELGDAKQAECKPLTDMSIAPSRSEKGGSVVSGTYYWRPVQGHTV